MTEQEKTIHKQYEINTLEMIHDAFLNYYNRYKQAKSRSEEADIGSFARIFVDVFLTIDMYVFLSDGNTEDFLTPSYYESDLKICIEKLERLLNNK